MTSPRRQISESLTVGGYKAGSLLAKLVPSPLAPLVSGGLAAPAALGMSERRRLVERHIRRAVPEASNARIRRMVLQSFETYTRYYLESFRLPGLTDLQVDDGMTLVGFEENLMSALERGKGAILALPHLGGWEWAGRWLASRGVAVTVVVEPLDPPELFEWFADLRRGFGLNVVPLGPEAASEVAAALGRNDIVCLLSDRFISGSAVAVEFFGETTLLPAGPAMLSIRTGAPLIPAAVYFEGRGSDHLGIVRPAIRHERSGARLREEVRLLTAKLAGELEILIKRAPEQWHLFQPNWPSDPGYPHLLEDHR